MCAVHRESSSREHPTLSTSKARAGSGVTETMKVSTDAEEALLALRMCTSGYGATVGDSYVRR